MEGPSTAVPVADVQQMTELQAKYAAVKKAGLLRGLRARETHPTAAPVTFPLSRCVGVVAPLTALGFALCIGLWVATPDEGPAAKPTEGTTAALGPGSSVAALPAKVNAVGAPDAVTRPAGAVSAQDKVNGGRYDVRWGDTLSAIADRYYGDPFLFRELAELNGLTDPDFIVAGQQLNLLPFDAAVRPR